VIVNETNDINLSEVIHTTCGICSAGCGLRVFRENGRVVEIKGDPTSPGSKGAICIKGRRALDLLYHPNRLKQPLLRTGERGENCWQPISWDEAWYRIAAKFSQLKMDYGARSVAFVNGAAQGLRSAYLIRLANAFGSPNFIRPGNEVDPKIQTGC